MKKIILMLVCLFCLNGIAFAADEVPPIAPPPEEVVPLVTGYVRTQDVISVGFDNDTQKSFTRTDMGEAMFWLYGKLLKVGQPEPNPVVPQRYIVVSTPLKTHKINNVDPSGEVDAISVEEVESFPIPPNGAVMAEDMVD